MLIHIVMVYSYSLQYESVLLLKDIWTVYIVGTANDIVTENNVVMTILIY